METQVETAVLALKYSKCTQAGLGAPEAVGRYFYGLLVP